MWSEIYSTDAYINGRLNVIPRLYFFFFFSNNFLKTFVSLMKHRLCKVCLPFLSYRMLNRYIPNCFKFLTDGYTFIRLVGEFTLKLQYRSRITCLAQTYEPQRHKSYTFRTCAPSEDSNQPAYLCRLI